MTNVRKRWVRKMDEKTIQRIKKLQTLAERGVGGEKEKSQDLEQIACISYHICNKIHIRLLSLQIPTPITWFSNSSLLTENLTCKKSIGRISQGED